MGDNIWLIIGIIAAVVVILIVTIIIIAVKSSKSGKGQAQNYMPNGQQGS